MFSRVHYYINNLQCGRQQSMTMCKPLSTFKLQWLAKAIVSCKDLENCCRYHKRYLQCSHSGLASILKCTIICFCIFVIALSDNFFFDKKWEAFSASYAHFTWQHPSKISNTETVNIMGSKSVWSEYVQGVVLFWMNGTCEFECTFCSVEISLSANLTEGFRCFSFDTAYWTCAGCHPGEISILGRNDMENLCRVVIEYWRGLDLYLLFSLF